MNPTRRQLPAVLAALWGMLRAVPVVASPLRRTGVGCYTVSLTDSLKRIYSPSFATFTPTPGMMLIVKASRAELLARYP